MSIKTQSQVISYIEKVFGDGKISNGGLNISVMCPVCKKAKGNLYEKKKLVIRTDNFVCHCWVCGLKARNVSTIIKHHFPFHYKEFVSDFLGSNQILNEEESVQLENNDILHLPIGFKILALKENDEFLEVRKAKRYLAKRGIFTEEELWYWKFGISLDDEDLKDRIIIPSFDSKGNLNYWTARAMVKASQKYLNPTVKREEVIFNEINIDWNKPIILTEGPFDLVKCTENATCLLGSALDSNYLLFQKIIENNTEVILALDEDAKDKALNIAKLFKQYSMKVRMLLVPKEKGDVGAMSKKEFQMLMPSAFELTDENYLSLKIKMLLG